MQLQSVFACAAVAFTGLASAAILPIASHHPVPTFSLPPLPTYTTPSFPLPTLTLKSKHARRQQTALVEYQSGYPLCGVAGDKDSSVDYVQTTYKETGSSRSECVNKCREQFVTKTGSCQSIAYSEKFGECLFYDKIVQDTKLVKDVKSPFVHYDLTCPII